MKIRATVTIDDFIKGEEYELNEMAALAMIIAGNAEPVAVAPSSRREKAVKGKYDTR
jgi:hypothetical protein